MNYLVVQKKTWEKISKANPSPIGGYCEYAINGIRLFWNPPPLYFKWMRVNWTPKLRWCLKQLLKGSK